MQADWFEWGRGWAADFFLRLPTLAASNFEANYSADPIFTLFKDLTKNQRAGCISRVDFALNGFCQRKDQVKSRPVKRSFKTF